MIKHVVCYKLIDNSLEKKQEVKNMLMTMKGKLNYFIDIQVGLDFLGSERSYDVVLEMTFNTVEDMQAYQKDEYHCNVVKKHMHAVTKTSIAIDYEI